MEEESFGEALRKYIVKTIQDIWAWLKPDPADSLAVQIIKGFFKGIVALFMIVFSPVVAIFLFLAFLGVF